MPDLKRKFLNTSIYRGTSSLSVYESGSCLGLVVRTLMKKYTVTAVTPQIEQSIKISAEVFIKKSPLFYVYNKLFEQQAILQQIK